MAGKFARRLMVLLVAILAVFALSACTQKKSKAKETLSYIGSSTIGENVIPEAFEAFAELVGDDVEIGKVEIPGSGKGIEALIQGKAELAGASRDLAPDEIKHGLFRQIIGYDAICVFVNKDNPVDSLTEEEIKDIFTGRIKNWKEVGGNDAPIVVITEIIGEKRATSIEFQKMAMEGEKYASDRKEVDKPRDEVDLLAGEKNGIAGISKSFNRPGIKAVAVNDIEPSDNNVRSGAYLLSRPLVLATKGKPTGELGEFIDFMVSSEGQAIVGKKFVSSK